MPVGIVHAQSILTNPQTVWRRNHGIWTKNFPPDMTSLESSLLDMHVAQEQHYVGGIFAMEEVFAKGFPGFVVLVLS